MKKENENGGTGGTGGTWAQSPLYIRLSELHHGMHFENKKCNQPLIAVSALKGLKMKNIFFLFLSELYIEGRFYA